MRRDSKKPGNTDRAVKVVRSSKRGRKAPDAASRKLAAVGRKMGNSGLDGQLKTSATQRDRLVEFILQRLATIKSVQNKELIALGDAREWYKQVAKGRKGFHLPDPTRWHESAEAYKRAIEKLCNGNLGEGVRQLDRALEAERAAERTVPIQVRTRMEPHEEDEKGRQLPDVAGRISATASCPTRDLPQGMALAWQILSVQDHIEQGPSLRPRQETWWEQEEEEEEEEDEEDG